MNPIIKWAGGKRKLLPDLVANMPARYDTYIEPFLGGGALFFHLQPKAAILGDSNSRLISMYRAIRTDWYIVHYALLSLDKPDCEEHYYEVRDSFNRRDSDRYTRAAQFIYLNKSGFNGLYRENRKGKFNVPFGKYKSLSLPSGEDLREAANALSQPLISSSDFTVTVKLSWEGDFIYCDPPYDLPDGHKYTASGFGRDEQEILSQVLRLQGEKGVKWMVSNSDTPFIRQLYADFNIVEIKAARSINSDGGGRGKITELLIKNY